MVDTKENDRYLFLFALRTFRRLLVSFALPLLLPLLVSFIVYTAAISSIQKEVGRANESALLLMKRIVDARLDELAVAADQLSLNEDVQAVSVAQLPLSPSQRLVMSSVQGLLRQFALANEFVDGIYLYLPMNGYVLSNVSRFAQGEFEYTAQEKFGVSAEEWKKSFRSSPYRSFRMLSSADPLVSSSFVFSQKMVFQFSGTTPAVLVIQVHGTRFLDLLDSFKWNPDAAIAIIAPDGRIAARPGLPKIESPTSYQEIPKEYHTARLRSTIGKLFLSSIGSDDSEWRYVYIVPSGTYSRSADFVKAVMAAYVAVCLIGGLVLSFFLARREYTPIRRLSRMFLGRLGDGAPGADGDFPYLEGALRDLLREHENLEELIRRQNGTVRNGLLSRLLRGGGATQIDSLLESCEACDISFPSSRCLVLGVAVFDGPASIGAAAPSEVDTGALVRYMLQPLLDELLGRRAAGYVVESDGGIRCVVSLAPGEEPELFIGDMKALSERIQALFVERFGIALSFAISRIFNSIAALPLAREEVDELIESIILYDRKDVTLRADEVESADERSTAVRSSLALHRSIAENAAAGDFAAVKDGVFHFLDVELLNSELPLQTAKLRISGIINIVLEALQEMRPALDPAVIDELKPLDRLSHVKSVAELKRQVEELLLSLESRFAAKTQDQSPVLKDEVVRYVEEKFRDRNLNVNSIADNFGVSVPHLSRTFKKGTGIGLLDYIHIVRIREAKRLMKENKYGIGEIAVMVGCGSRVTLVRSFKRYEGIAPSVFREEGIN